MTPPLHRRVRYGIVGFGRFAEKAIAPAIRASANAELVALQKRSLAEAERKAREFNIPLPFDTVERLVAHPDVDAVFIVSANVAHCAETLAAAGAGKHVIVEKPMANSAAEAEKMITACRQYGVKLQVGHMLRFSPLVRRMKELVRSGSIGEVNVVRSDFYYNARLSHRTWLFDRSVAGGGPLVDIGVHCLDTLRFVLDDEVASVHAELQPPPSASVTESTAQLLLRFAGGVIGSIYCSYLTPVRQSSIEIFGTEAVLSAVDFTVGGRTAHLTVTTPRNDGFPQAATEEIEVPNLYVEEITHFSDCILKNQEPLLSGLNGLQNQRVLDAALTGNKLS